MQDNLASAFGFGWMEILKLTGTCGFQGVRGRAAVVLTPDTVGELPIAVDSTDRPGRGPVKGYSTEAEMALMTQTFKMQP